MQNAGFYPAGRAHVREVSARRSVSPHVIADVSDIAEGADVGREGEHEDALFDRMLQPFDQDVEEKGEEEEKEEEVEDEEAEAINPRVVKAPVKPTTQEVEAHMTTHLPYRSWCAHCVRGKARGKPHPKASSSGKTIPTIAIDYMFMHSAQAAGEE